MKMDKNYDFMVEFCRSSLAKYSVPSPCILFPFWVNVFEDSFGIFLKKLKFTFSSKTRIDVFVIKAWQMSLKAKKNCLFFQDKYWKMG